MQTKNDSPLNPNLEKGQPVVAKEQDFGSDKRPRRGEYAIKWVDYEYQGCGNGGEMFRRYNEDDDNYSGVMASRMRRDDWA